MLYVYTFEIIYVCFQWLCISRILHQMHQMFQNAPNAPNVAQNFAQNAAQNAQYK